MDWIAILLIWFLISIPCAIYLWFELDFYYIINEDTVRLKYVFLPQIMLYKRIKDDFNKIGIIISMIVITILLLLTHILYLMVWLCSLIIDIVTSVPYSILYLLFGKDKTIKERFKELIQKE